jgi:hypothetical protein
MLITFRSHAVPDVLMFRENAQPILDLLHKDAGRGVITAAEMGEAVQTLEQVIDDSRAHTSNAVQRDVGQHHGGKDDAPAHARADGVSFAARAFPLLEMLRAAKAGNSEVLWGV